MPFLARYGTMPLVSRSLDNAIHALNTLAKIGRVGDKDLGAMLGMSRQTGYAKRHGETKLSLDDIDDLATGLGVPPIVFLYDHQELMRWIGETNWRGPNATSEPATFTSNCDQATESDDLRLFDPDELPAVIDLRDHRVVQTLIYEEPPALYAIAN